MARLINSGSGFSKWAKESKNFLSGSTVALRGIELFLLLFCVCGLAAQLSTSAVCGCSIEEGVKTRKKNSKWGSGKPNVGIRWTSLVSHLG